MQSFTFKQPEVQTNNGAKNQMDSLDNPKTLERSFFAVEEPFVINDSIPRSLSADKQKGAPSKSALNLFGSYDEASRYAVAMNRPLVILEIKPAATVKPQPALVSKLGS